MANEKKPERTTLAVTIDKTVHDRLEAEADSRMIGKGLIVEKAITAFLDRLTPVNFGPGEDDEEKF